MNINTGQHYLTNSVVAFLILLLGAELWHSKLVSTFWGGAY